MISVNLFSLPWNMSVYFEKKWIHEIRESSEFKVCFVSLTFHYNELCELENGNILQKVSKTEKSA